MEQKKRASWWQISCIILAVIIVFGLLIGRNWNTVPPIHIPKQTLPSPSAYDYYVKAGDLQNGSGKMSSAAHFNQTSDKKVFTQEASLRKANILKVLREGFAYKYVQPRIFGVYFAYDRNWFLFRNLSNLLERDGMDKETNGDYKGAANSYLDEFKLGTDIKHGSPMGGMSCGKPIQDSSITLLVGIADHLNAKEAKWAAHKLDSLISQDTPLYENLEEEKWCNLGGCHDFFSRPNWRDNDLFKIIAENCGSGAYRVAIMCNKSAAINEYAIYMDKLIADSKLPYAMNRPDLKAPKTL